MRRLLIGLALLTTMALPGTAHAAGLRVGVGRADITPLLGGYKGGWSCTCAHVIGQQERLYARVVVLEEGSRRVALVSEDLFALSAGMIHDASTLLPGLGFNEANIIDSATHNHSSPSGYMSFSSYNSILPSNAYPTPSGLSNTAAVPEMYDLLTRQLALAIRRAVRDLHPGMAGWGRVKLLGVTQNRSLGAHLANYGVQTSDPNGGSVNQDPGGYAATIDPWVYVLRVDQMRKLRGRTTRLPVGVFSTFANHGTVDHENFWYLAGDHQGAAERVLESGIRAAGHVPPSQDVVGAFANGDAGDMTSGIRFVGPSDAEYVGRREAAAMLAAWRVAGHSLSDRPVIDVRSTRVCFCGQMTSGGAIDTVPWIGKAAGAGSEEGRTIFFDDGAAHEGDKLPVDNGPQGNKITVLRETGNVPQAVPFSVVRIGDGAIATVPGEPTVGVGGLIRTVVGNALRPAGVKLVDVVGFAGDYLSYFTTPLEYEQQAYEGGFTLFGHYASLVLTDTLGGLARDMASGAPAPAPYTFDSSGGTHLGTAAYGRGAPAGVATTQPRSVVRLGHAVFAWKGGANGIDRPVDRAFITVQRRAGRRWITVTDDLGMQLEWSSDPGGAAQVSWEAPLTATAGRYRFLVTAKRYRLVSGAFTLRTGAILTPKLSGGSFTLAYPQPYYLTSWTLRPTVASSGKARLIVDGRSRVVRAASGGRFAVPAGRSVVLPAHGARDSFGNTNGAALRLR